VVLLWQWLERPWRAAWGREVIPMDENPYKSAAAAVGRLTFCVGRMGVGVDPASGVAVVQFGAKALVIAVAIVSSFLAGWTWGRVEVTHESLDYTRDLARWTEERGELEGKINDLNAKLLFPVPPPLPRAQSYFK
jgi:hypothetical protein